MKTICVSSVTLGEWVRCRVLTFVAMLLVGIAGFSLVAAQPAFAQHKTILVVAPHPDDEALCCSGVIYSALQQGNTVYVAVVTNGDAGSSGTAFGEQREAETIAAMKVLGLGTQNVIFLGYGDQALQGLYQSTSPSTVMTSEAGQTQTYANAGPGGVSYHQYLNGAPGSYNRQTILADMKALLQNIKPDEIYTTGVWDDHPDHVGTFNFLIEALLGLRKAGVALSPRVHETLIHAPCSSCGVPTNANYLWPGGGVGIVPSFYPTQAYPEPYYLGSMTPYEWDNIENIPVPGAMQNPVQTANLKAQVLANYVSQGGDQPVAYLYSWSKKNEWFWIRDFVTNVAGLASVTASSDSPDSGQVAASVVDGFIEGDPGYAPWEWATNGQLNGAWIKLTWPSAVTISNVVLYNRQDGVDDVISGTLSFSDGSSLPVGQLPISGNGSLVSFSPRTVTSMTFTINRAVGQNIGLTEIEVFGEPSGSIINHPQIFEGPIASAPLGTDQYGQQYVASISDSQTTSLSVTAFDVDGRSLSYSWTTDAGLISGSGSTVTFIPPIVSSPTLATATVTVSDGAGGTTQNSVFISVVPTDSSGIVPSSLLLSPSTVPSGSSSVGTVSLNRAAPDGAVVAISSSSPALASVPATVTIAPGASSATFPISTTYVTSNAPVSISASVGGGTQSATLTLQAPSVTVSSIVVSPTTVGGSTSATGTVTMSGAAPTGGAVVNLSSSNTSVATVPPSVTIAAGATTGTFAVTTQSVSSAVSVTLSTSYVGQTSSTSLRIAPYVPPNLATIATVSVSSEDTAYQQQGIKAIDGIVDGSSGDYTKEWATNGQLAGAWITLTWSVPVTATSVVLYDRPNGTDNITAGTLSFSDGSTVPVGALPNDGSPLTVSFSSKTVTSMTFTVNSAVGQNIGLAEIAVIGTVHPATQINSITVTPGAVIGGTSAVGTVALNGAAASGGTAVTLASNNTAAVTVPSSVTVATGSTTVNFPVTTKSVSTSTAVSLTGTYGGTQSATLTVNPVTISAFSLTPSMVAGGSASSTGLINLNGPAPAGGAVITLSSSNTGAARVPANITIAAGASSGSFTVTTTAVSITASVTIGANYNGQQNATLLVTPQVSGYGMVEFALDSFNRTDGNLGSNWTTIMDADSSPLIQGQQIQSAYGRAKSLYYGGLSWPANQYSQVQILASNGGSSGPTVRMTSYGNYYAGTVGSLGNGNANVYILIDNNESQSVLASTSSATVLAGDYIQLSVNGSTLTLTDVTQSQTLLTATDTSITAGYPGMYVANGGTLANWSGGLATQPPAITVLASDNFNRANAQTLGSNWSIGPGYYSIQIINNQIESAGQGQAPGQGHGKEYYTGVSFPGDQWSQAQVISATNDVNGAMVRYQGTVDTHYVGFISRLGGPGTCSVSIDRDIAGAPAVLATDSTYCSVSSGDFIRLQVQGSLLSYIDVTTGSLLLTTQDSQITGGSPGWSLNPNGGAPVAANWSGGKVGP